MAAAANPPPARRREAWGHHEAGARRPDPPHLVDWPPGTYRGRALCGKEIEPVRIDPDGTARRVDVALCSSCLAQTEPVKRVKGGGQVVDLAARRAQRGLW